MTTNEIVQTETGLINHCKRINERLRHALTLMIEITGQHYDESETAEADTMDAMSDLLNWIQAMALKAEKLMAQLEYMKEQF